MVFFGCMGRIGSLSARANYVTGKNNAGQASSGTRLANVFGFSGGPFGSPTCQLRATVIRFYADFLGRTCSADR